MNTQNIIESSRRRCVPRQLTAHEFIVVLSRIYSDAGLPAKDAYLAAVADYECSFRERLTALL
jgi:hypothetical protein